MDAITNQDLTKEVQDLKDQIVALQRENQSLSVRALKVYEENTMIKSNPAIAAMKAEMDYHLAMADRFIKSKAFKFDNAEQAYTVMKAGKEMGMSEVESLNALYIVNGSINFWGDAMISRLTKHGYAIEYADETDRSVTVRVTKGDEVYTERVNDTDQILQRSKAMGFAKKNKMRFHGIRMIASFHLAHLFSSVSDFFTEQYHEVAPSLKQLNGKSDAKQINIDKENLRILEHIRNSKDTFELAQVEYHLDTDQQKEAFAKRLKEIEQHLDFVPVKELEQ